VRSYAMPFRGCVIPLNSSRDTSRVVVMINVDEHDGFNNFISFLNPEKETVSRVRELRNFHRLLSSLMTMIRA
jgi:hypothetical protein